jgi:hypothetical protein
MKNLIWKPAGDRKFLDISRLFDVIMFATSAMISSGTSNSLIRILFMIYFDKH